MGKPGVMFYFAVRPCIKRLSCEEKGRLFEAILDYGEFGTVPEFEGMVGVAWDFIQPRIDQDSERYDGKVEQRRYAVYTREAKKHGLLPLPFEKWVVVPDEEKHRLISDDNGRYPNTIPNSVSDTDSNSITDPNIVCNEQPTQFTPPTLQEVADYCREKGCTIDPERFVSYYSSIGWMVGKNPMRDWKAAVRTWERSEGRGSTGSGNRGSYTPPDDDLVKYF